MTDMYLLFEWTEEREAKMHLAITSSVEKAKKAAELSWKNDGRDRGATDEELEQFHVEWEEHEFGTIGMKKGPEDEDLVYRYDGDVPYEIELFVLDEISLATDYDVDNHKVILEKIAL
jgi:hypothetical protein